MRKLIVYNFVTLNGYFQGPDGDLSWNGHHDAEGNEFAGEMLGFGSTLLFGRVTYEMMAGYWPSPDGKKSAPHVANGMNMAEKIVFSKTMKKASWNNSRVVSDIMEEEIMKLKKAAGKDMTVLGSGSLVSQLTDMGLVDEYQIMVNPVALGEGTPIFKDIRRQLNLKLAGTRTFKSGVILLTYQPVK
ncbi:dihydrofolate reductase family protein [Flavitalea flava]